MCSLFMVLILDSKSRHHENIEVMLLPFFYRQSCIESKESKPSKLVKAVKSNQAVKCCQKCQMSKTKIETITRLITS